MEKIFDLHIEKLPEGFYLGMSDGIQDLVAQGRTISETLKIVRNVAKKIIKVQVENIESLMINNLLFKQYKQIFPFLV